MLALSLITALLTGPTPEEKAALDRTVQLEEKKVQESPEDGEALYRLGLAYLSLGQAKKATGPLALLVKRDPESLDGKLLYARALRLSGSPQEAKALLEQAILSLPDESTLRAERALLATQLGETDVAVAQYQKAVELNPMDPSLRFNLGEALEKRGQQLDAAVASYRKALELKPDLTAARVNLARALASKGLFGEAKDLLGSVARDNLNDAEAHYNLGVILMREGNVAGAVSEYERTLAIAPKHAQALNNLGVALDAQAKHPQALDAFQKATKADPAYAEAFFNLGLSYYRLNDTVKATRAFEQALKLEPASAGPYTQLGELYLRQGKKDRAVEAFKKAIAAQEEAEAKGKGFAIVKKTFDGRRSADAYQGLALAYLAQGNAPEAVATLKRAVDKLPKEPNAHLALGEAQLVQGDYDAAVASFQRRLELEPTTEAKVDLARALSRRRSGKAAEALYREVLKVEPNRPDALLGLADLLVAVGRLPEAETVLADALKTNPEASALLARYGVLESRLGRPDKALGPLQRSVEMDPSQLEARAELAFLYFRGGEEERAMRALSDVLAAEPRQPLAIYYRGVLLFRKGQAKLAEESFLLSTQLDPQLSTAFFSLGELYESQGKKDEAKKAYEAAAKLDHREAAEALKKLK